MADKGTTKNTNASDEIDLGQLFQLIGKGFDNLFRAFLRFFIYIKKNAWILLGLIVLGVGVGVGLNQVITKKMKTEVIVKPNMQSKNYLYDVIDEVEANIIAKDTLFFKSIGIELSEKDFNGLEVMINPVDKNGGNTDEDIKYLEILQNFEDTDAIDDIVRAELRNNKSFNHRITFYFKDHQIGVKFAKKVLEYINNNEYFDGLIAVYRENALSRIDQNEKLLKQLDEITTNYTKKLGDEEGFTSTEKIVFDNQETVNITGLFELKNTLIHDIESKKLELEQRSDPIRVINFGRTQQVQKAFFGKNIILIPLLLVGLFFLVAIASYLDKKASEMS